MPRQPETPDGIPCRKAGRPRWPTEARVAAWCVIAAALIGGFLLFREYRASVEMNEANESIQHMRKDDWRYGPEARRISYEYRERVRQEYRERWGNRPGLIQD